MNPRKGHILKEVSITGKDCDFLKFERESGIIKIGYYENGTYKSPRFYITNMSDELRERLIEIWHNNETDPHFSKIELANVRYNNITKIWIAKIITVE